MVTSVPWPHVIVTLARSADGASLDLALQPGPEPSSAPIALELAALTAGSSYRLRGDGVDTAVVAAADGTATVEVAVDRPLRLRLTPEVVAS